MKDIILVDNLTHSFGLQIDNGIPILEFINQTNDKELLELQNFLIYLAEVADARCQIKEKLPLRKILLNN